MVKISCRCFGIRIRPTAEHLLIVCLFVVLLVIVSENARRPTTFTRDRQGHRKVITKSQASVDNVAEVKRTKDDKTGTAGSTGGPIGDARPQEAPPKNEDEVGKVDTNDKEYLQAKDEQAEDDDDDDEGQLVATDDANEHGDEEEDEEKNNNELPKRVNDLQPFTRLRAVSSTIINNGTLTEVERLAAERQRHLAAECARRRQVNKKWPKTMNSVLVNDKLKAVYCMIGKVASSTWKKVFLSAMGNINPSHINDTRHMKLGSRALKALRPLHSFGGNERRRRLETYFRFFFVRHPFDRLTSTYLEKFRLLPKSIRATARRIIRKYRVNATAESLATGNDVTFEEFIRFLLDHGRTEANIHWVPQSKLCLPCAMRYDFVGHYETIWTDGDYVLRRLGAPDAVKFPRWDKPRPAGNSYGEMMAKVDRRYVEAIRKFYAQDFDMFGYT